MVYLIEFPLAEDICDESKIKVLEEAFDKRYIYGAASVNFNCIKFPQ